MKILPEPPCSKCHGYCCVSGRNVSVELMNEEIGLYPEAIKVNDGFGGEVFGIPNVMGRCIHLNCNNQCGIYERRPHLCKQFNCLHGYLSEYRSFLMTDNPDLVKIVELNLPEFVRDNNG